MGPRIHHRQPLNRQVRLDGIEYAGVLLEQHGEPVVIEGSELLARAIQHETDHLDGILFIDRLTPELRKVAMKEIRESEWFGAAGSPRIKVSPHPTGGLGL